MFRLGFFAVELYCLLHHYLLYLNLLNVLLEKEEFKGGNYVLMHVEYYNERIRLLGQVKLFRESFIAG